MITYVYLIFEFLTNVFQSLAVTHFFICCFGVKSKQEKPYAEYITGGVITLIYLEALSRITAFENIGVFIYLGISVLFCVLFLKGSIFEKIFYNLLMIAAIVFSSMAGAGIVSSLSGRSYSDLMYMKTSQRYLAIILIQVILSLVLWLIVKIKRMIRNIDLEYMGILAIIPIISIIIFCALFFGNVPYKVGLYTAFGGIVIINIASLLLLVMEHRLYEKHLREKNLIEAYKQKEKDVEAIKMMKLEMDKIQHDNKKVYKILSELLNAGEYEQAKNFIAQYTDARKIINENVIYCENVILNILLNRKVVECRLKDVSFKCFIQGEYVGIQDVDLYILLENLLDNALEAACKCVEKRIDLDMYADESGISMRIGNSVNENVTEKNPNMITTKADRKKHGFGLQNVRDVVKKYDGVIEYDMKLENYLLCKVMLKKSL